MTAVRAALAVAFAAVLAPVAVQAQTAAAAARTPPEAPPASPPQPVPPGSALVAIVIDDVESLEQAVQFGAVPLPLAFAVLPTSQAAPAVAAHLSVKHREYLIHLPMEPIEADHLTGPGFLNVAMDEAVIAAVLARHLEAVPGAKGANNHMGSRFTADAARMEAVLRVLAKRGMYWVDSRTAIETAGRSAAAAAGVPELDRDVFLDNDPTEEAIAAKLAELVAVARQRGCAVGIGHPRPGTAAALARFARELADAAARKPAPGAGPLPPRVEVVPVSRLLSTPCRN